MKHVVTLAYILSFISLSFAQNQLFIVGDGSSNASNPELYIQGGQEGFIYVEGGVVADGTNPTIVNNGGIFIEEDSGTPGDFSNSTSSSLDISAPTPTALSGTLPTTLQATEGGTVHLISGDQAIIGNNAAATTSFHNLSLEGAGNTTKSLSNADATVNNKLYLNDEYLHTQTHRIIVANGATDAIERAGGIVIRDQSSATTGGMVVSDGNGRLVRLTNSTNSYLFPVGLSDLSMYRPIDITPSANDSTMYEARMVAPTPNTNMLVDVSTVNPAYYHRINRTNVNANPPTNGEIRIYTELADVTNATFGMDCDSVEFLLDLGIAQSANTSVYGDWTYVTSQGGSPITVNNMYYINSTAYPATANVGWQNTLGDTEEGYVVVGKQDAGTEPNNDCVPLFVSLYILNATPKTNFIQLDWGTQTEVNNAGFYIERSLNRIEFESLGWQEGNGTTSTPQAYSYNDFDIKPNQMYFYRLKQVDLDGAFTYTNVVAAMVLVENQFGITDLYPNPTSGLTTLGISSPTTDVLTIKVFNSIGQVVEQQQSPIEEGYNEIGFDFSGLSLGAYYLSVENTAGDKAVKKVILQ